MAIDDFLNYGKGYIRNPLGIIGLFIALVYGFASLVLTFSANLLPEHISILVCFLVIFPFFLLGVFFVLVAFFHSNLYGPRDFRNEDNFFKFKQATVEEQNKKTVVEMKLDEESVKKSKTKDESDYNPYEFRKNIFLAEDLVIRLIEDEYKVSINRHVKINPENSMILADGMFRLKDTLYLVEVKYLRNPTFVNMIISRIFQQVTTQIEAAKKGFVHELGFKEIKLILVIVTSSKISVGELNKLEEYSKNSGLPIDLRVHSFEEIKKEFGIE